MMAASKMLAPQHASDPSISGTHRRVLTQLRRLHDPVLQHPERDQSSMGAANALIRHRRRRAGRE